MFCVPGRGPGTPTFTTSRHLGILRLLDFTLFTGKIYFYERGANFPATHNNLYVCGNEITAQKRHRISCKHGIFFYHKCTESICACHGDPKCNFTWENVRCAFARKPNVIYSENTCFGNPQLHRNVRRDSRKCGKFKCVIFEFLWSLRSWCSFYRKFRNPCCMILRRDFATLRRTNCRVYRN